MIKVGLVTCFLDNYGACLQAYALQNVIEKLGNSCEIIRFTEPNGYAKKTDASLKRRLKDSKLYYRYRCAVDAEYAKAHRIYGRRSVIFKKFRKEYLHLSERMFPSYSELETASLSYDKYVCGSDQIWNPTFYNKCNPAYYLAFVPDDVKKIAYAPSIGLSDIPSEYQDDFKKYVSRLDSISCRESKGCELIAQYTGRESKHVLDPTLLLKSSDWEKLIKNKYRKPYIICYLFGQHSYYTEFIDRAKKHFGCDVLYIPFFEEDTQNEYIKLTDEGPAEFIGLIKNAKYVITDSFHATVFSIIFEKNFSVLLRDSKENPHSMNSRLTSILARLKLTERFVYQEDIKNYEFSPVNNYAEVHCALDSWRNESMAFLEGALKDE